MIVSMFATMAVEDVADAAPTATRWAQMYMLRDRGRTQSLAERARDAGYGAIVASVDGAAVGRGGARGDRGRAVTARLDAVSRTWRRPIEPTPPTSCDSSPTSTRRSRSTTWRASASGAGFPSWSRGSCVRTMPRAVVDAGAAAIAVSNHGGRIFDGVAATADVLPEIVDAVSGNAEVYVDGGIRSGAHVARALALGATAVLSGRPVLWGLVLGGEAGARRVLELLRHELEATMAFCGAPTVGQLTPDLIRRHD